MVRTTLIWLILTLAIMGCSRRSDKTVLIVYSPHGKDMLADYEHRFEQEHPDVDVRWLDMGSQDVLDRIRTERQNPQADVWWGGPMTMFDRAAKEGLLERYVPTWADAVPTEERGEDSTWYGTFETPEVIMFNTALLTKADAPQDWDDLLDPKWRGRILLRSPLASGTMRVIFSAMMQKEAERTGDTLAGYKWLRRLDANTKTYVADPTQLYLRIGRGEAPLSVWNLPDVLMERERSSQPFGVVAPASGTPVITDAIAIVHGTRHRDLAQAFYEFVTTRESLIHQAEQYFRIPARRDIPRERLPEWLTANPWIPMKMDWRMPAMHEQQWMQYWDEHVKGTGQ